MDERFKSPLDKAIQAIGPAKPVDTKDKELRDLEQLFVMSQDAFHKGQDAEFAGRLAKCAALKLLSELKVRIEIRKLDLGIMIEDEDVSEEATEEEPGCA